MARSRSLPSNLFEDPDFFELSSNTQIILIGLVLIADDHGRGLAHTGLLARKFNKTMDLIEETLVLLEQQRLLICYQDEQHRYYALSRWTEWETLSKPAKSKYPDPQQFCTDFPLQQFPEKPQIPLENSGTFRDSLKEEEEEEESEEEGEGEEESEEEVQFSNVVTFVSPTSGGGLTACSSQEVREATRQVARILKLAKNAALSRVVAEYLPDPTLSVLGEADAAREWMDDPRRNRNKQRMTPAFFRRWLKREQTDSKYRQFQSAHAVGAQGQEHASPSVLTTPSRSSPTGRSLMDLEAQYQAQKSQGGK